MQLIEILLPVKDNSGNPFPDEYFTELEQNITKKFGGVTAFTRAPAEGQWKQGGETVRDEIIIFEVEVAELDKNWWKFYRQSLEKQFRQDIINIRAYEISKL